MVLSLYHVRDYAPNTNVMQAGGAITFVNTTVEQANMGPGKTLASRLKWARAERGLSQAALGEAARVSQGAIGNIESGERKKPRDLLSIARALRVNPNWLETGKGHWDAGDGTPYYEELSDSDRDLVRLFNEMLDEDQRRLLAEIAQRAEVARAERQKWAEKFGVKLQEPKLASERMRSAATARATVEPRQQSLDLPPDHRPRKQ